MKNNIRFRVFTMVICICLLSLCGCGSSKKENVKTDAKDIPGTYSETKLHFDDNVSRITLKNDDWLDIEDKGLINEIVSRLNALPLDDKKSGTTAYSGWDVAMDIYVEGAETPYNLNITDDHINSHGNYYYLNGKGSELQEFRIFLNACINLNNPALTAREDEETKDPKIKQANDQDRICLNDYVDISVISANETGITYTVKEKKTFDVWDNDEIVKDDHYNSMTLDERYTLEVLVDDQWVYAKSCLPVNETVTIPSGNIYPVTKEGTEITTNWNLLGSLPAGHYRLRKWVNPYNGEKYFVDSIEAIYISIEFEIE